MLVLSRRTNETIRFPQLGVSVSILSVKGSRVQVGVDAPSEIQIIRKELEAAADRSSKEQANGSIRWNGKHSAGFGSQRERHDFKNLLNRAILGLHLAQKQLNAGKTETAEKTLATALARLRELDDQSASQSSSGFKPATDMACSVESPRLRVSEFRLTESDSSSEVIDVLLVEDDRNEQVLMKALLEMEGYRVHTANNGNEAMERLESVKPQCVLLDMLMPECDGPETLKRMRNDPAYQNLPVFAVSGTCPESVGVSIGNEGVEAWFSKPLNAPWLIQSMRNRTVDCLS